MTRSEQDISRARGMGWVGSIVDSTVDSAMGGIGDKWLS